MTTAEDTATFEAHRDTIKALAYRMLGDTSSAEDIVQDTWLRWCRRDEPVADARDHVLNGQPALVAYREGRPLAAMFLAIADGRIVQVFLQADPERLRQLA